MKNIVYIFLVIITTMGIISCNKKEEGPQKWEYKTLVVWGNAFSDFYPCHIDIPQAEMDTLGAQGWELVDVYTRVETAHPNFGNDKYVTGLQPNVRTSGVFYVFKRPKQETTEKETAIEETVVEEVVEATDSVAP